MIRLGGTAWLTVVLVAAGLAQAGTAVAVTPAAQLGGVERLVAAVPDERFAEGRRAAVLALAADATAAALADAPCRAAEDTDRVRALLLAPATWADASVPSRLVAPIDAKAVDAGTRLLRQAGRDCGVVPRTGATIRPRPGDDRVLGVGRPTPTVPTRISLGDGRPDASGLAPVRDRGAPTIVAPDRRSPLGSRRLSAAQPLRLYRANEVGVVPYDGAGSPTAAVGRGVVWQVGDGLAAFSVDFGRTFRFVDPSTMFPDVGLPPCCGQAIAFAPTVSRFVWLLTSWCDPAASQPRTFDCSAAGTGGNRIRLAVAAPAAIRANIATPGRAWLYYDLPASVLGLPAGTWLDRPDLVVGPNAVTLTASIGRGGGSVIARVALEDLVAGGPIELATVIDPLTSRLVPARGDGRESAYAAGGATDRIARVWSWRDRGLGAFVHPVSHTSIPLADGGATDGAGDDWLAPQRAWTGSVEGAALAGDRLWLAWTTGRAYCAGDACVDARRREAGRVFPQPAIQLAIVDVRDWQLDGERWLWSEREAYGLPSLATNGGGDVGIAFLRGAPGEGPRLAAGYVTDGEELIELVPESGPVTADRTSLAPGPDGRSLAAAGAWSERDGGGAIHWVYGEMGRTVATTTGLPQVTIRSPLPDRVFREGQTIVFHADASDPEDGRLPPAAIRWFEDGARFGSGETVERTGSAPGRHTIRVVATNSRGAEAAAQLDIVVEAAPQSAPVVSIIRPADDTTLLAGVTTDEESGLYFADVQLVASATDAGGEPLTATWTDSVNGKAPAPLAEGLSPRVRLLLPVGSAALVATHDLVLTVSDGTSVTQVGVRVLVQFPFEVAPIYADTYRGWPTAPVDGPHAVYGTFLNPTMAWRDAMASESVGFHEAIDIPVDDAKAPEPVYALEGGIVSRSVTKVYQRKLEPPSRCGVVEIAHFQYSHVLPVVNVGMRVRAGDPIATTCPDWWHVHLAEFQTISGKRVPVNPLRPGGKLGPIIDRAPPVIEEMRIYPQGEQNDPSPTPLPLDSVRGVVVPVALAMDRYPLREWPGAPEVPLHVFSARVDLVRGASVLSSRTLFRVDRSPGRIWEHYFRPLTRRSAPVAVCIERRIPDCGSRLWLRLSEQGLDTRTLPNGRYTLVLTVDDVVGRQAIRSLTFRVAN